ncbi:hypothetical protein [Dactylosporangium matsuzakiense]|uniref:Uncharacterized protein n=1 Tax=Dactylosporangium matsuzakiense TaxID=53360 RepID=A0A9W6KCT4_9ACTN|nr:hypothetical protein [Dactylosporangium matsuzakiense]UWZ44982.1 hypothetical protein Dmats_48120 [Dactylosporangium matsuzakiense]GLK99107.1 hypothetical protein GCM10017581_008480 [Dactylosporangium matsuzakiense]
MFVGRRPELSRLDALAAAYRSAVADRPIAVLLDNRHRRGGRGHQALHLRLEH